MMSANFNHFGIAVSDINKSTHFFERVFVFEIIQSRKVSHEYLGRLVGCTKVEAAINMLRIDENSLLEIIQWSTDGLRSTIPLNDLAIYDVGAQHLCLNTSDANVLYSLLTQEEVTFLSDGPIEVLHGPNEGAKVFFVRVFGNLFIEIFEKPKT